MNVREIKRVYFVGIGGIGMSALARFFRERGAVVSGYDRTETELTMHLAKEGMSIHYTDDAALADKNAELVVYTPAIPRDHKELNWYRDNGYKVYKRSDVLQWITNAMQADWCCLLANTSEGSVHSNKSLIIVPMDAAGITRQKIKKIGMNSTHNVLGNGSRANAAKLRNMPATLIMPRPIWPRGRRV